MISDIDKTIGALEEELRQSSGKTSQQSSSSFCNNKSLNIKKNDQEKKRVPIWRVSFRKLFTY